jgi:hypothetical protein
MVNLVNRSKNVTLHLFYLSLYRNVNIPSRFKLIILDVRSSKFRMLRHMLNNKVTIVRALVAGAPALLCISVKLSLSNIT